LRPESRASLEKVRRGVRGQGGDWSRFYRRAANSPRVDLTQRRPPRLRLRLRLRGCYAERAVCRFEISVPWLLILFCEPTGSQENGPQEIGLAAKLYYIRQQQAAKWPMLNFPNLDAKFRTEKSKTDQEITFGNWEEMIRGRLAAKEGNWEEISTARSPGWRAPPAEPSTGAVTATLWTRVIKIFTSFDQASV
jgi:hypothetical protein